MGKAFIFLEKVSGIGEKIFLQKDEQFRDKSSFTKVEEDFFKLKIYISEKPYSGI